MKKLMLGAASIAVLALASTGAFAAKYDLRLSTVVNAPHPWIESAEMFAKEVNEKTNGEVEVTIFPGAQLGKDAAAIDQMRMGTVDFVIGGTTNAARIVKEFGIFSLSYLFEDIDAYRNALDPEGPVFNKLKGDIESRNLGFKLIGLGGGGTRVFSNNKREIHSVADVAGLKMRVPGAKADALMWGELGAMPTSLPFNEVYSALQTGVVSAFESSISSFNSSKFYEVAKYMALTNHQVMTTHFSVSSATMNRLPDEYRAIVEEAGAKAGQNFTEAGQRFDAKTLEALPAKGVTITKVDISEFAGKLVALHDKIAEDAGYADLLQLIRENKTK